MFVFLIDVAI